MSFVFVRDFFRQRLVDLGFSEHDEPFQPTIIAANITDGSFHMETGLITSDSANQIVHSFNFPVKIRIYRAAYNNVLGAYDKVHEDIDVILEDFLNPVVRLGPFIKDIVPESIQPVPFDITANDNIIILEMDFTIKLELCYKQ